MRPLICLTLPPPPPPLDQNRSPSPTLDQHRSLSLPPDQHRLPPTLGQHRSLSLPPSLLLRAVRLLGLCTLQLHRTLDQLPFALIGVPASAASGATLLSAASAATPISAASAATPVSAASAVTPVSAASASFAVAAIAVEPLVSRRHRASPVSQMAHYIAQTKAKDQAPSFCSPLLSPPISLRLD